MWYCDFAPGTIHEAYHADEYGYPRTDDDVLCERLILEIMQAGLSWELILKRRDGMREAFDGFHCETVAAYGDADRERLLADARIIRNRRKVDAAIENARRILALRADYGSFHGWLTAHHPRDLAAWVKLFRATFVFTGPEVVNEFLVSLGWLGPAHRPDCPACARIAALAPPWAAQPLDGGSTSA